MLVFVKNQMKIKAISSRQIMQLDLQYAVDQEKYEQELKIAHEAQKKLLPDKMPEIKCPLCSYYPGCKMPVDGGQGFHLNYNKGEFYKLQNNFFCKMQENKNLVYEILFYFYFYFFFSFCFCKSRSWNRCFF